MSGERLFNELGAEKNEAEPINRACAEFFEHVIKPFAEGYDVNDLERVVARNLHVDFSELRLRRVIDR